MLRKMEKIDFLDINDRKSTLTMMLKWNVVIMASQPVSTSKIAFVLSLLFSLVNVKVLEK